MVTLECRDIGFSYRKHVVFDGLTVRVSQGRTLLLGPNGAGKSTLLTLLSGVLAPKSGDIFINDTLASIGVLRKRISLMPQNIVTMRGLTVAEQIAYVGWLKGMTRQSAKRDAEQAIARVGLDGKASSLANRLSGGESRRLGLASALMGSPSVLLLDEPTAGLDPEQRARFRDVLVTLPKDMTVIVSTHQIDDIGDLFDRVCLIESGKIRWHGDVGDFLSHAPADSSRIAEDAYLALMRK